jgi:hypothetical protein
MPRLLVHRRGLRQAGGSRFSTPFTCGRLRGLPARPLVVVPPRQCGCSGARRGSDWVLRGSVVPDASRGGGGATRRRPGRPEAAPGLSGRLIAMVVLHSSCPPVGRTGRAVGERAHRRIGRPDVFRGPTTHAAERVLPSVGEGLRLTVPGGWLAGQGRHPRIHHRVTVFLEPVGAARRPRRVP